MAENQYVPADVSHSELLRYHLQVSTKVDNELAVREAKKTLALLDNPPVHKTHPHAEISHDAQKASVNENNNAVNERVKKTKKEVDTEKKVAKSKPIPEYKVLTSEEAVKAMKEMEQQVKAASARTVVPVAPIPDPLVPLNPAIGTAPAATVTAPAPPWLAAK